MRGICHVAGVRMRGTRCAYAGNARGSSAHMLGIRRAADVHTPAGRFAHTYGIHRAAGVRMRHS
eukprot:7772901-Pyramimonas_sp.AAC.2